MDQATGSRTHTMDEGCSGRARVGLAIPDNQAGEQLMKLFTTVLFVLLLISCSAKVPPDMIEIVDGATEQEKYNRAVVVMRATPGGLVHIEPGQRLPRWRQSGFGW